MLRRAVTLVAGLSELTRKIDDFFDVGSSSRLAGGEGSDGGSSGSLGHEKLHLKWLVPGEL